MHVYKWPINSPRTRRRGYELSSRSGTARVGELEFDVRAHDFVFAAAGVMQGMRNQSDTESLDLLSVGALLLQSEWPHNPANPKDQGNPALGPVM